MEPIVTIDLTTKDDYFPAHFVKRPDLLPAKYPNWPFKLDARYALPTRAVMIDLETVDNIETSVVIQLACIAFNPQGGAGELVNREKQIICPHLDLYVQWGEEDQPDRTRSNSTIEWWKGQDLEVIQRVFGNPHRVTLAAALEAFEDFCYDHKVQVVMAHPPRFDLAIIQHAFRTVLGREFSVPFFQEIDVKTLEGFIFGRNMRRTGERYAFGDKHMALDDCIAQAAMVQGCYLQRNSLGSASMPTTRG